MLRRLHTAERGKGERGQRGKGGQRRSKRRGRSSVWSAIACHKQHSAAAHLNSASCKIHMAGQYFVHAGR
eukprot:2307177-Karenia_brevis.AAC.1